MGPTRPRPVVLDAGALIGFDRGDPRVRRLVRRAVDASTSVVIPAGVLAQAWRDGARQAQLARLVADPATHVEPLDEPSAKAAGTLCGRSGTSDVVDASVALVARLRRARVMTSDPDDLRRLDPHLELEVV